MSDQSIKVPVHLLLPSGEKTSHPYDGEPCIEVGISFEKPIATPKGKLLNKITMFRALIDTGAQWNLIDETLVKSANSPPLETLINHGVTGSSTITNHSVSLMFMGPLRIYCMPLERAP